MIFLTTNQLYYIVNVLHDIYMIDETIQIQPLDQIKKIEHNFDEKNGSDSAL